MYSSRWILPCTWKGVAIIEVISTFFIASYISWANLSSKALYSFHSWVALPKMAKTWWCILQASTPYTKTVCHNPITSIVEHKNKWESVALTNGWCVMGVATIPYPWYEAIITLVSNSKKIHFVSINNFSECTYFDFIKMCLESVRKKGHWMYCKHVYYVFWYLCKFSTQWTCPFMLQPLATTKWCAFLSSLMLLSLKSLPSRPRLPYLCEN